MSTGFYACVNDVAILGVGRSAEEATDETIAADFEEWQGPYAITERLYKYTRHYSSPKCWITTRIGFTDVLDLTPEDAENA